MPLIQALPEVLGYMPVKTEIRVVFPAPLGPKRPNIYLSYIDKLKGFKAI